MHFQRIQSADKCNGSKKKLWHEVAVPDDMCNTSHAKSDVMAAKSGGRRDDNRVVNSTKRKLICSVIGMLLFPI
jgi:hypothetical protein